MKILVIKLSALGDFILALGVMEAIRRHHAGAHITLLTTKPFQALAERSGYFDNIVIDPRPSFYQIGKWLAHYRFFNKGGFDRVYDLQLNDRTKMYHALFRKKPEWSGVVSGHALFYPNPDWRAMHAFKRHQEILKVAGIDVGFPDLSWMTSDLAHCAVPKPYVLLIPGSAPTRPEKRWPARSYAALSLRLMRDGYHVALLGTDAERGVMEEIRHIAPEAIDLSGRTTLFDIAALARGAAGAVGNDTGPTHIAALAGCPIIALFALCASNPEESAPVGANVKTLAAETLDEISISDVSQNAKFRE